MADEMRPKCTCGRCRTGGLMAPLMLITVGAIFLLGRFTSVGFEELWPVILVVAGVVLFVQSSASRTGHTGGVRNS